MKALGVVDVVDEAADFATGAKEQASGLQEINTAINQMDQVTQQNAATVEDATAARQSLLQTADRLSDQVGQFNIGKPSSRVERTVASKGFKPQAHVQTLKPALAPTFRRRRTNWTVRRAKIGRNSETSAQSADA